MDERGTQTGVGKRAERPWGWYESIFIDDGYQVKRILVKPGQRLSYQSHEKRSERWIIISGYADVTLDDKYFSFGVGEVVEVGIRVKHRITNSKDVDLMLIEVQLGSYLGEDDIVRYQDDYGRVPQVS